MKHHAYHMHRLDLPRLSRKKSWEELRGRLRSILSGAYDQGYLGAGAGGWNPWKDWMLMSLFLLGFVTCNMRSCMLADAMLCQINSDHVMTYLGYLHRSSLGPSGDPPSFQRAGCAASGQNASGVPGGTSCSKGNWQWGGLHNWVSNTLLISEIVSL